MKAKRRRHEPQFKARVALEALEALKGIQTIQQIAKESDIHPVQVPEIFNTDTSKGNPEKVGEVGLKKGRATAAS